MKNVRNNITLILLSLLLTTFFSGCFLFPPTNQAPTIISTEVTTATVGVAYTYDVEATDPDGDTLTYSLTTKPADMNINSITGVINWTPDIIGDYDVSVNVEDGTLNDIQSFIIKVSKSSPVSPPVTPQDNSEEIEYKEVVSAQIDLELGGVVEVTDESSEIFGTRFVVDKNKFKKNNMNNKTTKSYNVNVVLVLVSAFRHRIDDYQGFLITPIVVMSDSDDEITGTLKIKYNEHKLSNSGVEKNDSVNVYRLKTTGGNMLATGIDVIPYPVSGATWEKVPDNKYSDENNIVKISIGSGDFKYYYTLTVTNCAHPSNLGNPLPGDLIYRLSIPFLSPNDNWLPGHVGIYVGTRYHEEDGVYNVIEELGSLLNPLSGGVQRTYYPDITKFGNGPTYMGAREPKVKKLSHSDRNALIEYADDKVGMGYAYIDTFGVYFGWAKGDNVKGKDDKYNCVGLTEDAYESVGIDIVSDYDEGNLPGVLDSDRILSPQEQLCRTAPASGIIVQNTPPVISKLESTPWEPIEISKKVTISCNATDQDNDSLTYIWTIPGLSEPLIKGKNIEWVIPNILETYTISCKVKDNYGGEDEKSVEISVSDPINHPPSIWSTPVTSATVNQLYTYNVRASDPDEGDSQIFSLTTTPSGIGINIDPFLGLISWTPDTAGDYDVTVKVSDGELSDTQSFTITVQNESAILNSITVSPSTMSLIEGDSQAIDSITAHYSDDSTADVALDACTYDSSNSGVATVDTGEITAVVEGTATITVSYAESGITKTDTVAVTVNALEVNNYEINWSTAESNGWANPLGEGEELITSTAYDYNSDIYLNNWGKKHTGTDIIGELDGNVYSIADGAIVKITRDYSSISNQSVVIIKHTNSNNEDLFAIYGHVLAEGNLEVNSEIETGEKIGVIKKAGLPVHLHFGINLSSDISDFIFTNSDGQWGWGRIPAFAIPSDYGWVDPIDYLNVHSVGNIVSGPVHNLTKDTYYNTIQAALDDADSIGGDTIEVADGTYNESIIFPTNKVVTLQSASGIRDNVIIQGANNFATVTTSVSSTGTTLRGFTITHTGGNTGRGIYIGSGNLIVDNCIISGNTTADQGGGIYNDGIIDITTSTISNNTATRGGGINNYGTLTIASSIISDNSAANNKGGGIYSSVTLTITSSTISDNTAAVDGGGIHNCGTFTITGSTISGNTSGRYGGGIGNDNGTLTIAESTISDNTADDVGGGIGSFSGTLTITGSTISDNSAIYDAGIYLGSSGTVIIGGDIAGGKNTICGNYIIGYSPSLDQQIRDDSGDLYETYKDTNYISAYCGVPTGPVHNLTKDTYYNTIQAALSDADSIGGDTIEVADGTYDESIGFGNSKKIILQSINGASSTIIRGDNDSTTITIGIYNPGATLEGFTITHADGLIGKGIHMAGGTLNINNCTISGNTADSQAGGGIYNKGILNITGSTISDNSTTHSGGGIHNGYYGILTIINSIVSGNSTELCGGGIYSEDTLTITGSTISDNTAATYAGGGGGIHNHDGTLTITSSTVSGNSGADYGGGICNVYGSSNITGSTISDNSADWGGGLNNTQGTLTITGSTISNNSVDFLGGGIHNYEGTIGITGNIISHNTANQNGGGIYLGSSGTINIGGDITDDKNTICGNCKTGEDPSLDQQIRDGTESLYETYKNTNYIFSYCE